MDSSITSSSSPTSKTSTATAAIKLHILLWLVLSAFLIVQCSSQSSTATVRDPSRRFYTIASKLEKPYLMLKRNASVLKGNDKYEGYAKDLAEKLSERLNFGYDFDVSASKYGHRFYNGTWNGIISMLMDRQVQDSGEKKVQLAIGAITITSARSEVVHFSPAFMEFQFALLMKKPIFDIDSDGTVGGYEVPHDVFEDDNDDEAENTSYIFLRPMTGFLWLVFLLSILLVVILIYIIEKCIATKWSAAQEEVINRERAPDSKVTILPKPVGFCTNGIIGTPRTTAGRFLQIIFWIYLGIFIAAYIATFAADRVVDQLNNKKEKVFDTKSFEPIVNTIEELIDQDDITFSLLRGGSTQNYFQQSSNSKFRKALGRINYNADKVKIRSYDEGVAKVRHENGSFIFIMEEPSARYVAGRPPCDLMVSSQLFGPKQGFGIAMSKSLSGDFVRNITLAILDMKEKEELDDLEKIWFEDHRICPRDPRIPIKSLHVETHDDAEEARAEEETGDAKKEDNDDGNDGRGSGDGDDNDSDEDDKKNGNGNAKKEPKLAHELDGDGDENEDGPLCIEQMAGAFYILATALIVALIVALMELCSTARHTIPSNVRDDKGIELQQQQQQQLRPQQQPPLQQLAPQPPPSPRPQQPQQQLQQQYYQQPQQRSSPRMRP